MKKTNRPNCNSNTYIQNIQSCFRYRTVTLKIQPVFPSSNIFSVVNICEDILGDYP